jgi:hypothetical protein
LRLRISAERIKSNLTVQGTCASHADILTILSKQESNFDLSRPGHFFTPGRQILTEIRMPTLVPLT